MPVGKLLRKIILFRIRSLLFYRPNFFFFFKASFLLALHLEFHHLYIAFDLQFLFLFLHYVLPFLDIPLLGILQYLHYAFCRFGINYKPLLTLLLLSWCLSLTSISLILLYH